MTLPNPKPENSALEMLRSDPLLILLIAARQMQNKLPIEKQIVVIANKLYGLPEDDDSAIYKHGAFITGASIAHIALVDGLDPIEEQRLVQKARIAPVPFALLTARDAEEAQEGVRLVSAETMQNSPLVDELAHIVGTVFGTYFEKGQARINDEEYLAGVMGVAYLATIYAL